MNPNYTDFKFPQIRAHPWEKVFRSHTPADASDLCTKLLEYIPKTRISLWDAMAHPFFNELRDPTANFGAVPVRMLRRSAMYLAQFEIVVVEAWPTSDHPRANPLPPPLPLHLDGNPFPPLFNFTEVEIADMSAVNPALVEALIPPHARA